MYSREPTVWKIPTSDITEWRLPTDVSVQAERVRWSYGSGLISDARSALDAFLDLCGKPEHDVIRFVRRWGALAAAPVLFETGWEENLWFYRVLPSAFSAVREIHAYIGSGEVAPSKFWLDLYAWPPMSVPGLGQTCITEPFWKRTGENDQYFVSQQVNTWLAGSTVRPALVWREGRACKVELDVGGSLFGALIVELLKEVSAMSDWVVCSNEACRKLYQPEVRRPRWGYRHFCPDCRDAKVPKRFAKRDFRARKRSPSP